MASTEIVRMKNGKLREYMLVFERVETVPSRTMDGWVQKPVEGEKFALYWNSGQYPKKMYFDSPDEVLEAVSIMTQEIGVIVNWD